MLNAPHTGPDGNDVLFMVTYDGTGGLYAVHPDGHQLATIRLTNQDDEDPAPYVELTRLAFYRLNSQE